jgi:sarcosine oxidase / L-pipecolate oxidase
MLVSKSSFIPSISPDTFRRDTDTRDLHFLIGKHPKHNNLFLATGGSAHGFKFLPVIGQYVVDMLESRLENSLANTWAWRPNRPLPKRRGPDPHPYPTRDLSQFPDFASSRIPSKL